MTPPSGPGERLATWLASQKAGGRKEVQLVQLDQKRSLEHPVERWLLSQTEPLQLAEEIIRTAELDAEACDADLYAAKTKVSRFPFRLGVEGRPATEAPLSRALASFAPPELEGQGPIAGQNALVEHNLALIRYMVALSAHNVERAEVTIGRQAEIIAALDRGRVEVLTDKEQNITERAKLKAEREELEADKKWQGELLESAKVLGLEVLQELHTWRENRQKDREDEREERKRKAKEEKLREKRKRRPKRPTGRAGAKGAQAARGRKPRGSAGGPRPRSKAAPGVAD